MNSMLALGLALFAVLVTIPVGSNRAAWWLLWTALLGLVGLYQIARRRLLDPGFVPRVHRFRHWIALIALVPAFAVLQALPLGGPAPQAAISVSPEASLYGGLRFLGYILLFALVTEVVGKRRRAEALAHALYFGVLAQAVWAIFALNQLGDFAIWGKVDYLGFATGTFVNRNSLATYLGMGLVLGVGLVALRIDRPRGRTSRRPGLLDLLGLPGVMVMLGQLVIFAALILTQSRGGVVSALIGLSLALALWRARSGVSAPRLALELLIFGLGLAVLFAASAIQSGLFDRVLLAEKDGLARGDIYRAVWQMVLLRPWTGYGFDAFAPAFETFRPASLRMDSYVDLAHNSYLTLWAEMGLVVGSVPPLMLMGLALRLSRLRRAAYGLPGMAEAALGILVLVACHSLTDFSLEIPANVYFLVLVLGLALARFQAPKTVAGAMIADEGPDSPVPAAPPSGLAAPRLVIPGRYDPWPGREERESSDTPAPGDESEP